MASEMAKADKGSLMHWHQNKTACDPPLIPRLFWNNSEGAKSQ